MAQESSATRTYTIRYKDEASNGEWRETTYTTTGECGREFLIGFFGLREPDVLAYEIIEP